MARWREMIMDYGQLFGGSEKSGPTAGGSDLFSITSDIKDKRRHDLHLRRTLEVHFRPLFQRFVYGGEKIACHDLRRILQDPLYRDRLPPDKVQVLADLVDFNRGKAINYSEFSNIVLNELPHEDIASLGSLNDLSSASRLSGRSSCCDGFLLWMCRNTAPPDIVEKRIEHFSCSPPPFFIILISLIQIIVYVVVQTEESDVDPWEPLDGGVPDGNVIMYDPTRRREAWRWITYCFLHQGYVDLIINISLQLFLGLPLEIMFSWWRVAIIYLVGVIIGSCSHSIADHYVSLVGGAGGSSAIAAAHLVAIIMNWKSFNDGYGESVCKKIVCSRLCRILTVLLIVLVQLSLAIHRRWFMDNISIKVGIGAQIGGILAGTVMSDAFLVDPRQSPMKYGAALIALFTFIFFVGVTVVVNIAWFDYPEQDLSSP